MTEANDRQTGPNRLGRYTSVVHFHGMGEQRRYEEISRLVDSLDVHSYRARQSGDEAVGMLHKIRARLETNRDRQQSDLAFIKVKRKVATPSGDEYTGTRFYETYWAPITAAGSPPRTVLLWLLKRLPTPIRMLCSHWRSRHRLHRAALHSLRRKGKDLDWADDADFRRLLHYYDEFEKPQARRDYPRGRFRDFVDYLEREHSRGRKETGEKLIRLARRWRRGFVTHELVVLLVFCSFLLLMLWGLVALVGLVFLGLKALNVPALVERSGALGLGSLADAIEPSYGNAFVVLLFLLSMVGAARWVSSYLGDVQYWSTFRETDERFQTRRQILRCGVSMLRHVLEDPHCERVVVTAHSLGTAIAMDCLLELGRHNRARNGEAPMKGPLPLEKISHLVTMGSPVDKIHYFFESHRTEYHRYIRIFDDVRGDIGEVPFAKNRHPHIHWVNIWDQADVVSGPLDSPSNAQLARLQVDNVEISSFPFPAPAASHAAYFQKPEVIGLLYDIIFLDRYNFRDAPRPDNAPPDLEAVSVGPGGGNRWTRPIQFAFLLLPFWILWILVVALSPMGANWAIPPLILAIATGALVGAGLSLNKQARKRFY